jgi:two-component SAPR family response regulator
MTSNVGQTGVSSIRLKGKRVEELPLGTNNDAKEQLVLAQETERLNQIAEVNAKYPSQRIDYLVSRIDECEENKNRMRKMIRETEERIQEYQVLVLKCGVRDDMLDDNYDQWFDNDREKFEERRRKILKEWGRWSEEALKQQIVMDKEAIERFEGVIDQEDASIKEFSEVIALCKQRDKELAALGAVAEGS